ncbi:MAG TPA: DUF2666 family protein [archaeon]|nr:DUF2666 family protein [archaeon]
MEESIQFVSNFSDWVAVKKIKVTNETRPKAVMEFLAGLNTSFDNKIEGFLRKEVDLSKVDAALNELIEKGKSADNISKALAEINGAKLGKVVKEITEKPEWQTGEQKEMSEFVKTYAVRKALKELGVRADYSHIDIPGMKKAKKVK